MTPEQHDQPRRWWRVGTLTACLAIILVGLVLVIASGRSSGILFPLLLLCPLLHLLMHRGHGNHDGGTH
jgi:hypothetical protein